MWHVADPRNLERARARRPTGQWRTCFAIATLGLVLFLSACSSQNEKLFASACENENANCQEPALGLRTSGARSDLSNVLVEHGSTLNGVLLKPIRQGETAGVEFTIRNLRLVPLRSFTADIPGGGFSIDPSAATDCSKKLILFYDQSCTVRVTFSPGLVVPAQLVKFHFSSLLGDPVEFEMFVDGAKIMSDFYITGSTSFTEDEVVFHPDHDSGPFYERVFTVVNSGSEDPISGLNFYLTGVNSDEYTIITGSPEACDPGGYLQANGGSCTITVRFQPTSSGAKSASLVMTGNGGFGRIYDLNGDATALESDHNQLDFGAQPISGTQVHKSVRISHPGDTGSPTAKDCSYGISGNAFSISALTCSAEVTAGDFCDVTIRMTPAASSEWHMGNLRVSCDERGGELNVTLMGQSVSSPMIVDFSILDFGEVLVGSSASRTLIFKNLGDEGDLASFIRTFNSLTGSGISISSDSCTDSLPSSDECSVTFTFAPTAASPATGSLNAAADKASLENETLLRGLGVSVAFSEPSIDFGTVLVGGDRVGPTLRISNPSSSQTASGCVLDNSDLTDQGFSLDEGSSCDSTTSLGPEEECFVKPRFTATAPVGSRTATLRYSCTVGGMAEVTLHAEATGDLRLVTRSPSSVDLRDRLVGITETGTLTVLNFHASDSAPSLSVSLPGIASPWARTSAGATDCSNFVNLDPGEICDIRLEYKPLATFGSEQVGSTSGIVSVSADSGSIDPTDPSYSGHAKKILASHSSYDFGIIPTHASGYSTLIVFQNPSAVDVASGCSFDISADFEAEALSCGDTLGPLQNCAFRAKTVAKSSSVNLNGSARLSCLVGGRAEVSFTAAVKKPPTLQWTGTAGFGDVDVGSMKTQSFTLSHIGAPLDSPTSALYIALMEVLPSGFSVNFPHTCPAILNPGQSCTVAVTFAPGSATATSDTLRAHDPNDRADLVLTGTGIDPSLHVVASTMSVNLTNRLIGSTIHEDVTLSNLATSGDTVGLSIGSPSNGSPWSLGASTSPCGSTLQYGTPCALRLVYAPTVVGISSGTVSITATNLTPAKTLSYSGSATKITPSVASLDFEIVDLNTETVHPSTVTVSNPSALDTASACSLTVGSGFTIENSTCTSSIAAGGSCSFDVKLLGKATEMTVSSEAVLSCAVGGSAVVSLDAIIRDFPDMIFNASTDPNFGNWDIDAGQLVRTFTLENLENHTVTLTNFALRTGGSASFTILADGTTCTSTTTLQPSGSAGGSCTVAVAFDPSSDTSGSGGESSTLFAQVSVPTLYAIELPLTGTGTTMNLVASASSIIFDVRELDQAGSETKTVTVTNTGLRVANLEYSTLDAPFSRGGTCGATLAGGASCDLEISIVAHTTARAHSTTLRISETQNGNVKELEFDLAGETVIGPSMKIKDDLGNSFTTSIEETDITGDVDGDRAILNLSPSASEATYEVKNDTTSDATLQNLSVSLTFKNLPGDIDGRMSLVSNGCTGTTLGAGQSCFFSVSYTPLTTAERSRYELSVSATSSITGLTHTVNVVQIYGQSRLAAALAFLPSYYNFSPIQRATTADSLTITLTNNGDQTATGLDYDFLGGNAEKFSQKASSNCGSSIGGGASCSIVITFDPDDATGAFASSFDVSGDQSGANVALPLKAASFHQDVIGSDDEGRESEVVADENRLYMVSKLKGLNNGSDNFRPLLTICTRSADGTADLSNCADTDIAISTLNSASSISSNFAGDLNGSGPKIAQSGDKIFIAVQNEDANLSGDTTGGTATIVTCLKPTSGNVVTDCAHDVVNSAPQSGQFPSLVVTSDKIVLSNTGADNQLIVTACSYNSASTSAALTLDPSNCKNVDFKTVSATGGTGEGWYTSTAFDGNRIVIATTNKTSGANTLRLSTCTIDANNDFSDCTSELTNLTSPDDGLFPSVVIEGTRIYAAHQRYESAAAATLRLTVCEISTANAISGCFVQTVSASSAKGMIPKLSIVASRNLWFSSVALENPSSSTTRAILEFHSCSLPVTPGSCSSRTPYASQPNTDGQATLYSRSHFLDLSRQILFTPYSATKTSGPIYQRRRALFQLGLWPELP
jgi:hypothetical protein